MSHWNIPFPTKGELLVGLSICALAVWKIGEIVLWAFNHIEVTLK